MEIYLNKEILAHLDAYPALGWWRKYRNNALTEHRSHDLRLWWSAIMIGSVYTYTHPTNVVVARVFEGKDLLGPLVKWAQKLTRKQARILAEQVIEQVGYVEYAIHDGRPLDSETDPQDQQNYERLVAEEIRIVVEVLKLSRKKKTVAKAVEIFEQFTKLGFFEGRVVVKVLALARERQATQLV